MSFTKEQVAACLERMNYHRALTITKETLDELIFTCQCNIPYDNLDVFDYNREVRLDAEGLYNKIVINHRGGYCFELNGFFFHILKGLGFEVQPCFCRIMFGAEKPADNFIDHRASIVTLDGQRYFCDVGTGAPMPLAALLIEEDVWQDTRGQQFCIRKSEETNWYELYRKVSVNQDKDTFGETLDLYFLDAAVQEIDFMTPNFFMYMSPNSLPHVRRMVSIKTPTGFLDITNDVFTEVSDGVKTERKLAYEELLPFIRERFDINITEPLRKL